MTEDERQRWKERRLLLREVIEKKRRSAHAPNQRRYRALVSVGLIYCGDHARWRTDNVG